MSRHVKIRRDKTVSPEIMEFLEASLPEYIIRAQLEQITGGLFTAAQMINLHGKRIGPRVLSLGDRAVYKKEEFLDWVKSYYGGESNGDNHGTSEAVCGSSSGATGTGEAS
jgi:hypothetical protein